MRRKISYGALAAAALMCWIAISAISCRPAVKDASRVLGSVDANPDLKAWFSTWRTFSPNLDGAAFRTEYSGAFPSQDADRFVMPKGRDLWDFDQWAAVVSSPDGAHAIGWSSGIEPDSQVYLIDLKTREAVRLLVCGTPCQYHLGAWLDSKSFVIAGTVESFDTSSPSDYDMWLDLFTLDEKVVTSFKGPRVGNSQVEEFGELWDQWLVKRFPLSRSLKEL